MFAAMHFLIVLKAKNAPTALWESRTTISAALLPAGHAEDAVAPREPADR